MRLDDFNHELPSASDAGLHVWVEVIGDDGDVDGQLRWWCTCRWRSSSAAVPWRPTQPHLRPEGLR